MIEEEQQLKEINQEIEEDNEIIEQTMRKLDSAIKVLQENIDKIKIYTTQQNKLIKNFYTKKLMQKLEGELLKIQTQILKTQEKLSTSPSEKLYTPIYQIEEANNEQENNTPKTADNP